MNIFLFFVHGIFFYSCCSFEDMYLLQIIRVRFTSFSSVEEIFWFFAVDMVLESRHTVYERMWPHYKGVVITDSYLNPNATIEVIIGSSVEGQNVKAASDVNGTAQVTGACSCFSCTCM